MNEAERELELLKRAMAEDHRPTDDQVPEFATMWSRAAGQMRPRRTARRTAWAVAIAAATVLAVAATTSLWSGFRQDRELEHAMTIAAAVGDWQAPLDFLLETPGHEWLETTPRWAVEPTTDRWSLAPELLEPVSLKEVIQ